MEIEFILDQLEITATPFALCELNGACDLGLAQSPTATLHYVLAGRGEIVMPGRANMMVSRGDLVLVPALSRHVLRSFGQPGPALPDCDPAKLGLAHIIHQSGNAGDGQLVALCANINLTLRRMRNLVDLIREPIIEHAAAKTAGGAAVGASIHRVLNELQQPRPGARAMINALLLQCMIELLRDRLAASDPALHWMQGLRDQRLWPVVRDMLDQPGQDHSVESLATLAGMSRSSFARHFQQAYGRGPMEMLREIRMRHAATLLQDTEYPVKRISDLCGFRSRSAFTRTFETVLGMSPTTYRADIRKPPGA